MPLSQVRGLIVAALLAAGIVATFLRELAFAWTFGSSPRIEVFRVAFALPNMLGQNLAPGLIGAAVPALAFAAAHGESAYHAMRQRVIFTSIALSVILAATCALAAPWLMAMMAPGFGPEMRAQAVQVFRILCVFILILGMTFGPRAVLSLRDVLWPGASSSLILSTGFILGCLLGTDLHAMAWSGCAAALVLFGLHWLARHRLPGASTSSLEHRGEARPPLLRPMLGILVFQLASALPRFLDRGLASTMESGTIAALDYSFSILTAPALMLGTTVVMIAFPGFSRAVARGTARLHLARRAGAMSALFAATIIVAFALHYLAQLVVGTLLGHGAFDSSASDKTSAILQAHALGFPAMVSSIILAQGIMALRRIRWLLVVGALRIGVRWIALIVLVQEDYPAGLGYAFAVTEWLSALLLLVLFALSLPPGGPTLRGTGGEGRTLAE